MLKLNFKGLKKDLKNNNPKSCCGNNLNVKNIPCCGTDISYPDTSEVKNPKNPKTTITEEFLNDFENDLNEYDISYVSNINDLFLHNYNFDFTSAIVICHKMPDNVLESEIGFEAQNANNEFYEHFGNITYKISDYLRKNGFETIVAHPREEKINFSLLAQRAGIGMIGKSGLFISPRFGPKQKISAILVNITNLPVENKNNYSWIRKYCEYCNSCIRKCPKNALSYIDNKIKLNDKICIGCDEGCAECIKACPFYKKGYNKVYEKYQKIEKRNK